MLLTVNGRMFKHIGSTDELHAMIGKAIQKGDLKYVGLQGNTLIEEKGTKFVQAKPKAKKTKKDKKCDKPSALVNGSMIEVCRFNSSLERQSFALLGKHALKDEKNKARQLYMRDHVTEEELHLGTTA
jgi:hypothetical protein